MGMMSTATCAALGSCSTLPPNWKKWRGQVFILDETMGCRVEMVLMVEYGPEALGVEKNRVRSSFFTKQCVVVDDRCYRATA